MKKENKVPPESKEIENYVPTPKERQAAKAISNAMVSKLPAPGVKVSNAPDGSVNVATDHEYPAFGFALIAHTFGTTSNRFADGILSQLANVCPKGSGVNEKELNFALAAVAGIAPKDETEGLLAAQMTAVHMATMTQARRLAIACSLPEKDSAERTLNKLARTFTTQMDALKRYRSTGTQRMIVERITVENGGQAVVGVVERPKDQGEG